MNISFNRTNKKHKDSGYKRFKVITDCYTSDSADLICINLPNAMAIKMEIVNNEISIWSNDYDLELKMPIYDTAIIDAKPIRKLISQNDR